jgi:hypothetical protein
MPRAQAGQAPGTGVPHLGQNLAPAGNGAPQWVQNFGAAAGAGVAPGAGAAAAGADGAGTAPGADGVATGAAPWGMGVPAPWVTADASKVTAVVVP